MFSKCCSGILEKAVKFEIEALLGYRKQLQQNSESTLPQNEVVSESQIWSLWTCSGHDRSSSQNHAWSMAMHLRLLALVASPESTLPLMPVSGMLWNCLNLILVLLLIDVLLWGALFCCYDTRNSWVTQRWRTLTKLKLSLYLVYSAEEDERPLFMQSVGRCWQPQHLDRSFQLCGHRVKAPRSLAQLGHASHKDGH